jgi:exonuclease VII small subunit
MSRLSEQVQHLEAAALALEGSSPSAEGAALLAEVRATLDLLRLPRLHPRRAWDALAERR